jgi:3-polyprenyl-4-hydroxybenzoate decarboxylase
LREKHRVSPQVVRRYGPAQMPQVRGCCVGRGALHDHAPSDIASGSKFDLAATKKLPSEDFQRPWPPLIKLDAAVKAKVETLFNP